MAHRRSSSPARESTPICRCRVLYLGSAVPHVTKDGLQGIQEPLKELYPSEGVSSAKGIDSWLSVWSNGLLLENVDEKQKKITRFFPIESLHYCAAVRYVLVPNVGSPSDRDLVPRFLPLDSPFARSPSPRHPPLFAAILRRTTGIKVLECHVFICKRETPANALVRCCFHAYADSMYARQLDSTLYGSIYGHTGQPARTPGCQSPVQDVAEAQMDVIEKVEEWQAEHGSSPSPAPQISNGHAVGAPESSILPNGLPGELTVYSGDDNHKVWAGSSSRNDGIYNEYETTGHGSSAYGSTGGRVTRPRQRMMPAAPPPPPPQENTGKKRRQVRRDRESPSSPSRVNGHHPRSSSVSNLASRHERSPGREKSNGHGPPNGYGVMGRPSSRSRQQGSRGSSSPPRRKGRSRSAHPGPVPAHMYPPQIVYGTLPPPVVAGYGPPMMAGYGHPMMAVRAGSRGPAEEPAYGAHSPGASFQPGPYYQETQQQQQYSSVDRKRQRGKRSKHRSKEASQSPPGNGIYQRKNHLNERAFGFSIQQEHRSRSYGSLLENGDARPVSRERVRKSRELQQMMRDLDLSGEELERSEPPLGVYRGPDSVSQLSRHSRHRGS